MFVVIPLRVPLKENKGTTNCCIKLIFSNLQEVGNKFKFAPHILYSGSLSQGRINSKLNKLIGSHIVHLLKAFKH
jgi:hypothetical protein